LKKSCFFRENDYFIFMNKKIPLMGLTEEEIIHVIQELGEKKFRGSQVTQWIYQKRVKSFFEMTNIHKDTRQRFDEHFLIDWPEIIEIQKSSLDYTVKFLLKLQDSQNIETVLMEDEDRITICISTQVGCPLNCLFCLTGKMGFIRNLTSGEIVSQVITAMSHCTDLEKRLNIVIMGMGEPLLNFHETVKAVKIMSSDWGIGLGKKRITLSTAGIPDKIRELADADLGMKLAVSLHSGDNEKRTKLMPVNKQYSLQELKESLLYFQKKSKRHRITFEYILIKDWNDSVKDAEILLRYLKSFSYKINIIPYNPSSYLDFLPPLEEDITRFSRALMKGSGAVTVRRSKGADILAACGQLKARKGLSHV